MTELLCLAPIRNGAQYLPAFLQQCAQCFDGLIALDDGSTDETAALLHDHPAVRQVFSHPVRASTAGWDDLLNRNTLLRHLSSREYRGWVLFLDVDELLDEDDARLLRSLIDADTLDRAQVYGLRVFRMVHDLEHFYKQPLTVYRLFYFQPSYEITGGRLHFQPVPHQLARAPWRKTNLRIKHRNSMTEALRQERFQKYREADPGLEFQESYANLLDGPRTIHDWCETRFSQLWADEEPMDSERASAQRQ